MKRSPLVLLLAALALAACSRRQATIPREKFVAASVALRMINDSGPHADSLRAAALKKQGVTAADLRRFVQVNGNRTSVLAKVWNEIDDSLQRRANAAPPSIPNPEPSRQPVSKPGAPRGPDAVRGPPPAVRYPPAQLRVVRPVQGAARSDLPPPAPVPPPLPPPSGPPSVQSRPPREGRPLPAQSRPIPKVTAPPESASHPR